MIPSLKPAYHNRTPALSLDLHSAIDAVAMLPSMLHALLPPPLLAETFHQNGTFSYTRSKESFLQEAQAIFERPLHISNLLAMSANFQDQFREKLKASNIAMLPSYIHTLPTGQEQGTFVALDVGGSTLRVALIELAGRDKGMKIVQMEAFEIGNAVRALRGHAFFDWMAVRIHKTLAQVQPDLGRGQDTLPMGLAWSFPVEQTSIQSGLLLPMGKGFRATEGVLGQDLGQLITRACIEKGLKVSVDAIINDANATLLAHAYTHSATRMSLILGTGTNAAIHLPVSALSPSKYGHRPKSWHDAASHVLVNTELSMFGRGILPPTRWDEYLNKTHVCPDFQPLEMVVSGRYLGEIVRLVLLEAITTVGLFGGEVPDGFMEPYSFTTGSMAFIEADDTPMLSAASMVLQKCHPSWRATSTYEDITFVRQICQFVSRRAAAYVATGVHALWALRKSVEHESAGEDHVTVSCNGSVIEKYPGFETTTQEFLDHMTGRAGTIRLEMACESSILGAAVAVACGNG